MKYTLLLSGLVLGLNSVAYALDGTGTQENPFKISTAEDLFEFANVVKAGNDSAVAIQMDNIILDKPWTPIGDYKNVSTSFKGSYDGQKYEIKNLTIADDTIGHIGLFSSAYKAEFKNIVLKECKLQTEKNYAAGICASASYSTFDGCYVDGEISAQSECAGIASGLSHSHVSNCTNKANITSNSYAGGICGSGSHTNYVSCYNEGVIKGNYSIGGIVGYASGNNSIAYCGNTGDVTDISLKGNNAAGLCGNAGKGIVIKYSYNSGTVKGGKYQTGALIAGDDIKDTVFKKCFYKEGCAKLSDGTKVYALGVTKGYAPQDDSDRSVSTFKNDKIVTSGALCCLLNQSMSNDSIVWFQKCGEGYPKTDSTLGIVYMATEMNCDSTFNNKTTFQNTKPENVIIPDHVYDPYKCKSCGHVDPNYVTAKDGFYQIGTADELRWFSAYVNEGHHNANAKLTDNIKLNNISIDDALADSSIVPNIWTEIGKKTPYSGTFDGQGYSIAGLYLTYDLNKKYTYKEKMRIAQNGLFGTLENAVVKNVIILDSYVRGPENVGSIAGYVMSNVTIDNCHNHGTVYGDYQVGGIVGITKGKNIHITNCSNSGFVTNGGNNYNEGNLGGIIGCISNNKGDSIYVKNCFNKGILSGRLFVGGIVGYCLSYTDINACYNIGEITACGNSAGIIFFSNGTEYKMTQCFNSGQITNVNTGTRNNGKEALCNGTNDPETCFNNYYLMGDIPSSVGTAMRQDQFASGEVCYKLNNGISDGSQPYFQNLTEIRGEVPDGLLANDTIDKHPVLDKEHRVVYFDNTYYNFFDPTSLNNKVAYRMPSIHTEGKDIVIIGTDETISLYDITGKCLLKNSNHNKQNEVRLTVSKSGVYMVAISNTVYKIIVK
ncbi:MAG: T9SS type A sorting domain-containing protein [Bacteroidales bacterium]|jgi:hypothetical protein|nr:T9SS type A sorting domain-containing protein [Bacteroidales bacterium]